MVVAGATPPPHVAPFRFAAFAGRVVAVSVVTSSRSPECTRVSGQFSYLQHRIDRRSEHLVSVIIDRSMRSDAAIARYASELDARADRWTFTGSSSEAAALMSYLDLSDAAGERSAHSQRVAIVDRVGHLADVVDASNGPSVVEEALNDVALDRHSSRIVRDALRTIGWTTFCLLVVFAGLTALVWFPLKRRGEGESVF